MSATLYPILEIRAQRGWARVDDFALGAGKPAPVRIVLDEPGWTLYTLDLASREAWFTEIPPDFDLSRSAFVYIDQHRLARRVLKMPLDALGPLAGERPLPGKIVFVFSIGRCGSTLVSHILNAVPGVWSLSEPIVYPRLIMDNYSSVARFDHPREELIALIRACTRLIHRPPEGVLADTFAVKFHSQSLSQADLYHAAFPEAACVFLYRDAIGWSKSVYGMARAYGAPEVLTGDERLMIWNIATAVSDPSGLRPYVDVDAPGVALEAALTPAWASNMAEYVRQLEGGVPFLALSYREINDAREATVARLLRHCGLPAAAAEGAMAVYEKDSQEGTHIARDATRTRLSEAQLGRMRATLSRHPVFNDPDLVLPDVYSTPT